MPTNYGLRTPLYSQATTGNSLIKSAKLSLTIDGVLEYTIVKDVVTNVPVTFEIAELIRDYLQVTLSDSFATPVPQKVTFTSTITFYDTVNAGGSAVGSPVTTLGGDGYEGYSLFIDGTNSSIPYRNRASNQATWLLAEKTPATAATNDDFVIFVPYDYSGYAGHMSAAGVISYEAYSTTDTSITINSVLLTIKRIDCTKYGVGTKVTFVNRFGVLQDLWFFLKEVKTMSRRNQSYQANTLLPDATYSQSDPTVKTLNTQAKQKHIHSSGYYPEWTNKYFEELLLSENVWITRERIQQPNTPEIIPVIVKTSEMTYKTSVNDSLIEYTIEFEDAFDYINNVR
tara:strand:+ start:547 stop:1572 length:1026 start_codon:yes stop_codon:yes gene_type:complete